MVEGYSFDDESALPVSARGFSLQMKSFVRTYQTAENRSSLDGRMADGDETIGGVIHFFDEGQGAHEQKVPRFGALSRKSMRLVRKIGPGPLKCS